jgi:hypothetical protein
LQRRLHGQQAGGREACSVLRTQGIFHGVGTEMVFFSSESTRIALR